MLALKAGSALSNPEGEVADTARQNVRFGAAHLTGSATSIGARNGGSARRGSSSCPRPVVTDGGFGQRVSRRARAICVPADEPGHGMGGPARLRQRRPVYSLTRSAVRSSMSTVTRTSIRRSAWAGRSSFAAVASSRALGRGDPGGAGRRGTWARGVAFRPSPIPRCGRRTSQGQQQLADLDDDEAAFDQRAGQAALVLEPAQPPEDHDHAFWPDNTCRWTALYRRFMPGK